MFIYHCYETDKEMPTICPPDKQLPCEHDHREELVTHCISYIRIGCTVKRLVCVQSSALQSWLASACESPGEGVAGRGRLEQGVTPTQPDMVGGEDTLKIDIVQ